MVNPHERPSGDSRGPADEKLPGLNRQRAPEPADADVSTVISVATAMILDTYMASQSILATVVVAVIVLIVALALG